MKIKVTAYLHVPFNRKYIGGTNPAIMTKTSTISRISDTKCFFDLLEGYLNGSKIVSFDRKKEEIILRGDLSSLPDKEIQQKQKEGWILNERGLLHYASYRRPVDLMRV